MIENKYLEKIAVSQDWIRDKVTNATANRSRIHRFESIALTKADHHTAVSNLDQYMTGKRSAFRDAQIAKYTSGGITANNRIIAMKKDIHGAPTQGNSRLEYLPRYDPKDVPKSQDVKKVQLLKNNFIPAPGPAPVKSSFKLGPKGKLGLGIGAAGALGIGAYALSRKKEESSTPD